MTAEALTTLLAERIMGWHVTAHRYLIGERRWLPRWRFNPAERLQDAFRLLEQAAPEEYSMGAADNGYFWVRVRVAGTIGEALESSKPRAITFAIARAFRVVPSFKLGVIGASRPNGEAR